MASLKELQSQFVDSIYQQTDNPDLLAEIDSSTISPQARMAVYRNNVFMVLINALELTFPVLQQLVGEQFFKQAAKSFIANHPSQSGNLDDYGDGFAAFWKDYKPAANYPYLPDIAALEWGYQQAINAPQIKPLRLDDLQSLSEEEYETLCLAMHPSFSLIRSPYPVTSLWQEISNDPERLSVDINAGGENCIIYRHDDEVRVESISDPMALFLAALSEGKILPSAYEQAVTLDPEFEVIQALAYTVQLGLYC